VDGVGNGTLAGSTCIGDGGCMTGTGVGVGVGATRDGCKKKFEGPGL
jgi:hypothetical protein